MIRETCSCGGSFVADYSRERNLIVACRRETRALEEWRANHRHETPAPTPECDHVWIAWGNVTELIAEYRCQRCDARKQASVVVDCDPTSLAGVRLTTVHEHDWDPGPNDFTGPPRCRVCGMRDVTPGGS